MFTSPAIEKIQKIQSGLWSVRGVYNDNTPDGIIFMNLAHYEVWSKFDCYDESGHEKFNLDFSGPVTAIL